MGAIKEFRRDCYQGLTSFAEFAHRIADGVKGQTRPQGLKPPREKRAFAAALKALCHPKTWFQPPPR
jgi:hypothetical protein